MNIYTDLPKRFKREIGKLFAGNLIFAFICGSFARRAIDTKSDLDFFICLRQKRKIDEFKRWYFIVHRNFNLKPDRLYPGEIMTLKELNSALLKCKKFEPMARISDRCIWDGIVWSGMLSAKKTSVLGNRTKLKALSHLGSVVIKCWEGKLAGGINHVDQNHVLKKIVHYESN